MKKLIALAFLCLNLIASATDHYVSNSGSDANNGLSASAPWKTIAKVNSSSFSPGDKILFNCGNTWAENLVVSSSGTAGNPIVYSSYGTGNLPVFSGTGSNTLISMANKPYIIIDGIKLTDNTMSATDHSIVSNIFYGIVVNNSSNTIIRNCDISLVGNAINLSHGSTNVTITNNYIHNLRMVINTTSSGDDWGANSITIETSNNIITHNKFEECWAPSYDYGYDGGVIEFFGTTMSNNLIAYNSATNCNGFLEIGSGSGGTANDNIIAYNKITNCGVIGSYHNSGSFAVSISNIQYYNNDIIETVSQYTKPGVMFGTSSGTCTAGMIVLKNNIFWLSTGTSMAPSSFNAGMTHSNNIFRLSSGSLGITPGSTELLSNSATVFTSTSGDPSTWNLHLGTGSPAINAGTNVGLTSDFDGNTLNNPPSIGIYESTISTPVVPVYSSSAIANATPSLLEMTYNTTLANYVPANSSFSVQVNSAARTVTGVAISGAKVQLTLASPVIYGDVVTVAYTKPSTNPLQTASSGQAASLSAQTVSNGVVATAPVYLSSAVANSTPSVLEMTYNMTLGNYIPATSAFSVLVNSAARTVTKVAISGTKVQLTLASPIIYGDVVTVAYTKPSTNPLQNTSGGQAATLSAQTVTNSVAIIVPVYVSSAVANTTPSLLEITYNLTLGNNTPSASAFSVLVNSAARTITKVAISGTKVQLTLSSPIIYGDVVTVAYTKPSTNPVQTTSGGQAASLSAQAVTNGVAAIIPVYVSSGVANATPSLLEMTYNLTLGNYTPATTAFSVLVNSSARTVTKVAISGTKVQLTLASPVLYGDVVTVAYTKPSTNPLQTDSGGQAASLSAQAVSNGVTAIIPVYVSSAIANSTPSLLEMTYNVSLGNYVPATSSFSVLVNSAARTVTSVAISAAKVQLTLASPIIYGDVVTVAYTKPSTNPLQTSSGGQAASLGAQTVANGVAAIIPVYVSSAVPNSNPSLLEITFNTALANNTPATSAFIVLVNSIARTNTRVAISGTKVQLTLASPILYSDVVTVAYNKPAVNPVQSVPGGQAASFGAQSVTNSVGAIIPVYVSSAVANTTPSLLEMTYNVALANYVPATSAFSVKVNSVARTVTAVAISGTKVQLTLASALIYGDVVTVAYTKPSTNPLQTTSGGQAVSLSAQTVTNSVAAIIPEYVSSSVPNSNPSVLEITYNATLLNNNPSTSAFSVLVNSVATPVTGVSISGTKVQLILARPVLYGDVVTLAYTKPSVNPVQTASGQAASISGLTVANGVTTIIPVYVSSAVANSNPSLLEIMYSANLSNNIPATSAYTVLVNSVARSVTRVAITGAKVQLTLASPVSYGDLVSVAYTKPSTNPLQTTSGGQAATLNAQAVANSVSAIIPVYVSSAVANSTPTLLEMTYNTTLSNSVPPVSAFFVRVNSITRTVTKVAISGSKVQLTLASPILFGDIITVAYTKTTVNPLQTPSTGQAATISAQSVVNGVTGIIPVYVSSTVANGTPALLEITYNMTLANYIPATSAFSVLVNSTSRTVNKVAISGTKVQLTIAIPIVYGDAVTVAYTKPAMNPIQTASAGLAVSLSAQNVVNGVYSKGSEGTIVIPVYVSSEVSNTTPSILEMTYNTTLSNFIPAASAFSVLVNSEARSVSKVAISGTKVRLTLDSPVIFGDIVTVSYTKPSANPLQTSTGQAVSINASTVDNNCIYIETAPVITNLPPFVRITNPVKSGGKIMQNSNISFEAVASDTDGVVSSVSFYNGSTLLAQLTSAPYSFTWKDVGVGTYWIKAVATDNLNASSTSDSINFTVQKYPFYDAKSNIIKLYPNPSDGHFSIEFIDPIVSEKGTLVINDMEGKQVYTTTISNEDINKQIDLSDKIAGSYLMIIFDKEILVTKKVVIY